MRYIPRSWLATLIWLAAAGAMAQKADPLPSWNDGPAKRAILDFVLEWTQSGGATRLMMLVHHDDAKREYA